MVEMYENLFADLRHMRTQMLHQRMWDASGIE
jgi:hypothetical protein